MADGPSYRVPLRRRREGKTNYYLRRELLKSGEIRVVIRRSTKHMRVQFIQALPNGDVTLSDTSSYHLPEFGWELSGGNIPAAYLTGYLAGKRALQEGVEKGILDLGLQTNSEGSRIYATLKGAIDAGVNIPAGDNIFPEEEIIEGSHIQTAGKVYKEQDTFEDTFALYSESGINVEELPDHVEQTREKIDGEF